MLRKLIADDRRRGPRGRSAVAAQAAADACRSAPVAEEERTRSRRWCLVIGRWPLVARDRRLILVVDSDRDDADQPLIPRALGATGGRAGPGFAPRFFVAPPRLAR